MLRSLVHMSTWAKLLSTKRLRDSEAALNEGDSPFYSDYGRVVHCSAFRRLQDKTQVNPLSDNDHLRRRLTHSVEVASVGERMARAICMRAKDSLPADSTESIQKIVATACLLHDIGNPPFGHEGEVTIREWADSISDNGPHNHSSADYRSFDGNAHGFRLAVRLQGDGRDYGLNLTAATLAASVKYPNPPQAISSSSTPPSNMRAKFGFFSSEQHHFEEVCKHTGVALGKRHPLSFIMEAADDIANRLAGIEDGLAQGLISYDQLYSDLSGVGGDGVALVQRLKGYRDSAPPGIGGDSEAYRRWRPYATGALSKSCEDLFVENLDKLEALEWGKPLIEASPLLGLYKTLKDIEKRLVLRHQSVVHVEAGGKNAIKHLLAQYFESASRKPIGKLAESLPVPPLLKGEKDGGLDFVMAKVVDHVAGMTDRFAIRLYQKLTGAAL